VRFTARNELSRLFHSVALSLSDSSRSGESEKGSGRCVATTTATATTATQATMIPASFFLLIQSSLVSITRRNRTTGPSGIDIRKRPTCRRFHSGHMSSVARSNTGLDGEPGVSSHALQPTHSTRPTSWKALQIFWNGLSVTLSHNASCSAISSSARSYIPCPSKPRVPM
jgi:hypothetical protein